MWRDETVNRRTIHRPSCGQSDDIGRFITGLQDYYMTDAGPDDTNLI